MENGTNHRLIPETLGSVPTIRLVEGSALEDYGKYFADESRREGTAEVLAFPASTPEVVAAVVEARRRNLSITVSNARTGITAGAVPEGGMLLSLERLNRIQGLHRDEHGEMRLRCEAGVLLSTLQNSLRTGGFADSSTWDADSIAALREIKRRRYFFPPDPTEISAAIGGMIACNASGAHSFRYGPTRRYVAALTVVLMDGRVLRLRRGRQRPDADGRFGLRRPDGGTCRARTPAYPWPKTKNAGGYYSAEGMDLLDLFVGSEGTLGIITEAELRLLPAPETRCSVMTFWPDEPAALGFMRRARERRQPLGLEAIEYFGPRALALLRQRRRELGAASGVPECLPQNAGCAIYLDVGTTDEHLPDILADLADVVRENGGDPDQCWSALDRDERERLRVFRHALPETVNGKIADIRRRHPGVTKLGTDMAVPDEGLDTMLELYRTRLREANLEYVVFGHIGDNHLHVNIIPENPEQYALGWQLYHEFAETCVALGGSPAAEHGIGKLKRDFLRLLHGDAGIRQMQALKRVFDPEWRLGVGTLFGRDDP